MINNNWLNYDVRKLKIFTLETKIKLYFGEIKIRLLFSCHICDCHVKETLSLYSTLMLS